MNQKLIDVYLDYVNDYVSTERFAEDYGLTEDEADTLINTLRPAYDRYSNLVGMGIIREDK